MSSEHVRLSEGAGSARPRRTSALTDDRRQLDVVSWTRGPWWTLSLGVKSAKDLSFGRREGFLARYERANALPPRPRVGRARVCPFFPLPAALAAVAPPKGRQLGAKCSVARRPRAEHRRSLEQDLLRATFVARGRCMHRRGPRRLGPMLSVRTQDTVCISVTTSWRATLSSA